MTIVMPDKVEIPGIGTGVIIRARQDDNGVPIYTVKLDDPHATPTGLYYARAEEFKTLGVNRAR